MIQNCWWALAIVMGTVAALILVAGHYVIDRARRGRRIPRVVAYAYGTMVLNGSFNVWAALMDLSWPVLVAPWIIAVIGGTAILACYILDHWVDTQRNNGELEVRRGQTNGPRSD